MILDYCYMIIVSDLNATFYSPIPYRIDPTGYEQSGL